MSDAVDLLKEQHAEVTALFIQAQRVSDPALCAHIFRTIDTSLRDHATIEEKIFYPAFKERARDASQADEVTEAFREHDEVKTALGDVERTDPASPAFKSKLESLRNLVLHHALEEETGMLRQARKLFTQSELDDLAHRMEQAAKLASPVYEMVGPAV